MSQPNEFAYIMSFRQPYATAIAKNLLCVSERSWTTPYRGPVVIHAAYAFAKMNPEQHTYWEEILQVSLHQLPRSCIVGIANLSEICPTESFFLPQGGGRLNQHDAHAVKLQPLNYLFFFEQAKKCKPYPFRGFPKIARISHPPLEMEIQSC